MATTMSRLVSFAISNLVIAPCSRSGGQIKHKSQKIAGLTSWIRRRNAMAICHLSQSCMEAFRLFSPILAWHWGRIMIRRDLVRGSEMHLRYLTQRVRSLHFDELFRDLFYVRRCPPF